MKFDLPNSLGVYILKNKSGSPLYVGKAININKRVHDHFSPRLANPKDEILTREAGLVEAIQVASEVEALILEANLIKKLKPRLNSQLKDDKDYLYINITKDPFPKVLTARKRDLRNSKIYFGPFPSARKVRETLRILRKIFPYSNCKPPPAGRAENQKRACLYFHLGLCPGVCVGKIDQKSYAKNIRSLISFLQGNKSKIQDGLAKEIKNISEKLMFEKAAEVQKRLDALNYITAPVRRSEEYLAESTEEIRQREIDTLAEKISLKKSPNRIECYDISNLFGDQAVGSMVVFTKGQPDRSEYRRFKIRRVKGISDTAMIFEVLNRRFCNDWREPDLIVVDGGRAQLNAALKVLRAQKQKIPVVALAKRFEEIFLPGERKPLRLSRKDDALKLIQRLRDEAHRFAISYHRKLRGKQFLTSV